MKSYQYCQREIEGESECKDQCEHCAEYYAPLEVQAKENAIKKAIEQGIREHLVITNEPGVKYAVDKIYKLINSNK